VGGYFGIDVIAAQDQMTAARIGFLQRAIALAHFPDDTAGAE
jgi:hypothetical protein